MPQVYTPGVCNIGPQEIKMRMLAGWLGLAATLALGAFLFWIHASAWTRLTLILPAFVSAIGFLQASFHFCVAFASKGLFNMTNAQGVTESVDKAEFRKADQKKAIQIWSYAALIALIVAFAAYYI